MTGPAEFRKKLEELEGELTNLNVQQKVSQPRTQEQLERVLGAARNLIDDIDAWEQTQQSEGRFLAIIEQLREYTAIAHDRLEHVEQAVGHDGVATGFPVDPEIIEEGQWLETMLAGPPSPDTEPAFLKEGASKRAASTLEMLVNSFREDTPVQQKARKA